MKNKFLTILFLSFFITPLYTVEIEQRLYKDASSLGMGGVGVSTIGYQFSAIRNPAALGLMADHDIIPFFSLGASINPEMVGLLKSVSSLSSSSLVDMDFDSLLGQAPSIGINGPLNIGYMGKGFGFWTTSSTDGVLAIQKNPDNIFIQNGIDINLNTLAQAYSEISTLQNINNGTITIEEASQILEKYLGEDLYKAGLTESDIRDTIDHLSENPEALKGLLPLAKLSLISEITVNLAYGYRIPFAFIDEVSGVSLGATVRFAQRFKAVTGEFQAIDQFAGSVSGLLDNFYQAGTVSSDFGVSLRLENFIFGVAVRDAFSTKFVWKSFNGIASVLADSQIPLSVDFGASYRFYFQNNWIQELGLYAEIEDATSKYSSWYNKVRVGSELKLFNFLDLRVGMYDGFVTGGLGMGWKWFRMDFTYYREKYFNFFVSDQFYFNMTIGLDNSPRRKKYSLQRQLQQDRIQAQNLELINNSLVGLESPI
ncbi:MAG: hypothetical protein ACRCWI_05145 [Brevinema sp.]